MIQVTKSITAENMFSDPLAPHDNEKSQRCGHLSVEISGTWTGTVVIQRSRDNGSTWVNVESYTANKTLTIDDKTEGVLYRAGMETGYWTSGTAELALAK